MRAPASVEDGIGDGGHGEANGGGGVDVLPHLAHLEPQDALDLLDQRGFFGRVLQGLAEPVDQLGGRPLAIDRQPLAVGQDERVLDHLAVDAEVHVDHLRGELAEGILKNVFPGGAAGAAAKEHRLDTAGRRLHVFLHAPPLLAIDLEPFHDDAGIGKILADRLANASRALENFGFDPLHRSLQHAQ